MLQGSLAITQNNKKNTETDRNKQEVQSTEREVVFHVCTLCAFLRSVPWLFIMCSVRHLLSSCIRHLHVCGMPHMSEKGQALCGGKATVTRCTVTHNDSQKRGGRGAAASVQEWLSCCVKARQHTKVRGVWITDSSSQLMSATDGRTVRSTVTALLTHKQGDSHTLAMESCAVQGFRCES